MKTIITTIKVLLIMTVLTGIIYPLIIFGAGSVFFPSKANGSLIEANGNTAGSELIAQKFESEKYFQPRPSAVDFQPLPSGASNLGPTSGKLKAISDSLRLAYILKNNLSEDAKVPSDAVYSSGSGLDPHISYENAVLQSERISKARNFNEEKKQQLRKLIDRTLENPQFGFLGEPRINVLNLNIELDKL
ncbi:MAG: potassium-transporting ATPase subunit KdpC [Ignavibacteria bacterium]|nr:potassium-transporting ATPase subunit KdpC [Ignavibacteria bacterium]